MLCPFQVCNLFISKKKKKNFGRCGYEIVAELSLTAPFSTKDVPRIKDDNDDISSKALLKKIHPKFVHGTESQRTPKTVSCDRSSHEIRRFFSGS